jgi:hypothetical protein
LITLRCIKATLTGLLINPQPGFTANNNSLGSLDAAKRNQGFLRVVFLDFAALHQGYFDWSLNKSSTGFTAHNNSLRSLDAGS